MKKVLVMLTTVVISTIFISSSVYAFSFPDFISIITGYHVYANQTNTTYTNNTYANQTNTTITCTNYYDNICPPACSIVTDADCCKNSGKYWLQTSWGYGCYDSNYNSGCSAGQQCSLDKDGCCPNWCAAGSDYDCCIQSNRCWTNGGCYDCLQTQTPTCTKTECTGWITQGGYGFNLDGLSVAVDTVYSGTQASIRIVDSAGNTVTNLGIIGTIGQLFKYGGSTYNIKVLEAQTVTTAGGASENRAKILFWRSSETQTCVGESQVCGGFVGLMCCENLICQYSQNSDAGTCVKATNQTECIDSDGYNSFYTKGKAYGRFQDGKGNIIIKWWEDYCVGNSSVYDFTCRTNVYPDSNPLDVWADSIYCPYFCKDGACINQTQVSEQVTCVFRNSNKEQECFIASPSPQTAEAVKSCKGKDSCMINVTGFEGNQVLWKSTCGHAATTIDGKNENAEFDCKVGEIFITEIKDKGFRYAYWQCYDGIEEKQSVNTSVSCQSSEYWQNLATEFCKGHCYADGNKCGVNSFSVSNECYIEAVSTSAINTTPVVEVPITTSPVTGGEGKPIIQKNITIEEPALVCKDSCPLNNKCYPFGYRKSGEFCSDEGMFKDQLKEGGSCENNFECSSNVCVNGQCVSSGLIQKIIEWFSTIFK